MTPGVDAQVVRRMCDRGISCADFFKCGMQTLAAALGVRFEEECRIKAIFRAREEIEFVTRHSIRVLFLTDDDYPFLLRETPDAPVLLYVLGTADLNSAHIFNVVGTRRCTSYGSTFADRFVTDMAAYFPDAVVVSGLAYGIDSAAHESALRNGVKTVAILAHGLHMIYPARHRDLARRILEAGGALVSEYPSGVRPFQRNFLERNRIVAGMCEFTVVVESEVRGGAMSTANQAFSYSREVVAVPGRTTDAASSGCNHLISRQKAHIYTGIPDLFSILQWKIPAIDVSANLLQPNLFPELEGDSAVIYEFLRRQSGAVSADEVHMATKLSMPALMGVLTELEFEGVIARLPGNRYELA